MQSEEHPHKKVRFIPEITLGNVLQLFAILAGLVGFMVANEHRMTKMEVRQEVFQLQVSRLTEATDKLVEVVNQLSLHYPDTRIHKDQTQTGP